MNLNNAVKYSAKGDSIYFCFYQEKPAIVDFQGIFEYVCWGRGIGIYLII